MLTDKEMNLKVVDANVRRYDQKADLVKLMDAAKVQYKEGTDNYSR